jgi:hypothetical protein
MRHGDVLHLPYEMIRLDEEYNKALKKSITTSQNLPYSRPSIFNPSTLPLCSLFHYDVYFTFIFVKILLSFNFQFQLKSMGYTSDSR